MGILINSRREAVVPPNFLGIFYVSHIFLQLTQLEFFQENSCRFHLPEILRKWG